MQRELEQKILETLSKCRDMTVATVRPDGAPQATVVSFAHDGLLIYFGCGTNSQKAANIAREPRVSIAMTAPYTDWNDITGLSILARAEQVRDIAEKALAWRLMVDRFPQISEFAELPDISMAVFRLRPAIISVLDYTKGFGHTDLVRIEADEIAETLESMRHRWMIPIPSA